MSAFLIARVNVTNSEQYENYKKLSVEAVNKYQGRFLARGGTTLTLEGTNETDRVVILEFDSLDNAKTFYESPDYQKAKAAREGAATGQFIVVDGV